MYSLFGKTFPSTGITSPEQSEEQKYNHATKCTHFRKGHIVRDVSSNEVVFDGTPKKERKGMTGINAAKRYVRENKLKSYTVV